MDLGVILFIDILFVVSFLCIFYFGSLIIKINFVENYNTNNIKTVYRILYKLKDSDDWIELPGYMNSIHEANEFIEHYRTDYPKYDCLLTRDYINI